MEVIRSRQSSGFLNDMIRGLMVESYLVEGSQNVNDGVYGKSITDPCLGWKDSEVFVKELAEKI